MKKVSEEEKQANKKTFVIWLTLEFLIILLSTYLFTEFIGIIEFKTLLFGVFLSFVNVFFRAGRKK